VADVTKGGKANWRDPLNSTNNEAFVPVNYQVDAKLVTGQNYGVSYSTVGSLNPRYRYIYSRTGALGSRPTFATQSFSTITAYGIGNTQQFILSTFSQYGVNIVKPSDNISVTTNFGVLVETINHALGSWGYSYYQLRTSAISHDNRILISTYYQSISSTQSWVLRYQSGSLSESDGPNLLTDTSGFDLGTNSSIGGWTIDKYYYP
jgi:hypothetical protein